MADCENLNISRLSQYKPKKSSSSQEERRKYILEQQKRLRHEAFNERRNIIEEIDCSLKKTVVQRSKIYKKKFMLSEWLLGIPCDFEEKWIMIPCPVGKRVLIVAAKGVTTAYAKDGRILGHFKSNFPGGFRKSDEPSKGITLLDCIWSKSNRSYYILDILAWNNQPVMNCEANFRFYWLRSKLAENPDILEVSSNNSYPFHALPTFLCDRGTLETALSTPLIPGIVIDGLLFYHSEADYTSGQTPLVGWLKPFMMCDLMQINLCEELLIQQPPDYSGHLKYINDFEENRRKKFEKQNKKCNNKSSKMEVSHEGIYFPEEMEDDSVERDIPREDSRELPEQENYLDLMNASSQENM